MIFLIGGPPRCGKTTLAKRLSHRLRIGWVATDILEAVVSEYVPKKNYPNLFPKTVLCEKTGWNNDPLYTAYPLSKILNAYIHQGKATWGAIETFVTHSLAEKHDFILEGHQIHPKLAARLRQRYPKEIIAVFLIKKDTSWILKGFQENRLPMDWVTQKTKDPNILPLIARMLSGFGIWVEKEAKTHHLPVYVVERNFKKTISRLTDYLSKDLLKTGRKS